MLGAVLLVGVLEMASVGEFIEAIEATGHERVVAAGLDRSLPLTEKAALKIAAELGIKLTSEHPEREVDRGRVQFLVWLLTPEQQERKRKGHHDHRGNPHSRCEP